MLCPPVSLVEPMTLENINLAMTTVWREENYLDATLSSLFVEYPSCHDQPVSLVIGSPHTEHLAGYRSLPGITVIEMGSHAWSWIENTDVRNRATWNYYRCLTQCDLGTRGSLIIEDDVKFARGWRHRLDMALAALEDRFGSEFALTIYDPYGWHPKESCLYAVYPLQPFAGTQGVYYPARVRQGYAKYLRRHGVVANRDHYDYLLRDYLLQEDLPLFATVPSLIQHVGRTTTGVGSWHEAPRFLEDVTQEPIDPEAAPMRLTHPSARLAIPKIIHHTWIGDDPLPPAAEEMMAKWRRHHPKWEMRLWTKDNLPPMQNRALYDRSKNTGHRADVLRYELLYQFGGVYADMDMDCQRSIDDLIQNCEGFAGRMDPVLVDISTQYMEIAILGAVPGHPLFARAVDRLPEWYAAHENYNVAVRTGPQYFQAQYLAWRAEGEQYLGEHRDFLLFRPALFYPYFVHQKERASEAFPEAYAIHRWWSSWWGQGDAWEAARPPAATGDG